MAGFSYNRCIFYGRLIRDPEVRSFANGGKVAQFTIAVKGSSKKDATTGKWSDQDALLDCKAFNFGEKGTMADQIEKNFRKGDKALLECHVEQEHWEKDGQKRSKLVFTVDSITYVGDKNANAQGGGGQRTSSPAHAAPSSAAPWEGEKREEIPF